MPNPRANSCTVCPDLAARPIWFKSPTISLLSQTFRRSSQTVIVPQRPRRALAAAKQTSSVTTQLAALVSHWYRRLTHQKTHHRETWDLHLYLLRMVRQVGENSPKGFSFSSECQAKCRLYEMCHCSGNTHIYIKNMNTSKCICLYICVYLF